eukprot:CAMPEP_0173314198 /NCGR_PEP_ID=MMETSP1143-20121109/25192_1 /TAXON_ID=483371 /ORGANISM="non described non described, Strain CCMP2298" /LENGTH=72 /DNA_ID=CAMNT_0014256753 /DNA_START=372 /DNA_END=587 /DNA_ORIENTATION=-
MDESITHLTSKFLKSLTPALSKHTKNSDVLADPALHIAMHLVACTRVLRDSCEGAGAGAGSASGVGAGVGAG